MSPPPHDAHAAALRAQGAAAAHAAPLSQESAASATSGSSSFSEDEGFLAALATVELTPPAPAARAASAAMPPPPPRLPPAAPASARSSMAAGAGSTPRTAKRARFSMDPAFDALPHASEAAARRAGDTEPRDADLQIRAGEERHDSQLVDEDAEARKRAYLNSSTYAPSVFGDIRTYKHNKRGKLKVQGSSLVGQGSSSGGGGDAASPDGLLSRIFEGTNCYINGHTDPPYAELRRLLLLHGGEHMVYLDTKTPCTHIIASSLTPKKRIEFRDYRTVRPEWVTQSIAAGRMLDWRRFRCDATAAGAMDFGAAAGSRPPGSVRPALPTPQAAGDWRSAAAVAGSSQVASSSSLQQRQPDPAAAASSATPSVVQSVGNGDPWGRTSAQTTLAAAVLRGKRHALPEPEHVAAQGSASPPSKQAAPAQEASAVAAEWQPTTPPRPSQSKEADLSPASWLAQLKTPPRAPAEDAFSTAERLESRNAMLGGTPPPSSAALLAAGEATHLPTERAQPIGRADERRVAMTPGTPPPSSMALLAEGEATQAAPGTDAHAPAVTPTRAGAPATSLLARPSPNAAAQSAAAQAEQAARHPFYGYASRPSNASAARLLSSPSWRKENTATSTGFLAGYYGKSRLHHLSTWKLELQDMVGQAMRESGRSEGSRDLPPGVGRVIMHVDFDSFFVTVGLRSRPKLREQPVAVCHGSGEGASGDATSTSEIASCNYVARRFGVRNGMSLGQARKHCPEIQAIPYEFEAYMEVSIQFYAILLAHADVLESVSIDEALLDVSLLLQSMRQGEEPEGVDMEERRALLASYRGHVSSQGEVYTAEKQLAEALRDVIRTRTGCEASIGIGANVLQARLATRKAKPGGSYHLSPEQVLDFTAALDVDDLHGVGWSIRGRLKELFGTFNVGELRKVAKQGRLVAELGPKKGLVLWDKLHGRERDRLEACKIRQSLGASVNYAIRFATMAESEAFVRRLCNEVAERLRKAKLRGRHITVQVMVRAASAPVEAPKFMGHGVCDTHSKSSGIPGTTAVDDGEVIFSVAWPMIRRLAPDATQQRGLSVALQKLEPSDGSLLQPKALPRQPQLNFARAPRPVAANVPIAEAPPPREAGSSRAPQAGAEEEDDDEEEAPHPDPLQPGPEPRPRRSPSPAPPTPRKPAAPAPVRIDPPSRAMAPPAPPAARMWQPGPLAQRAFVPPPGTQFAIPSQIDDAVVAALPARMQEQVAAARAARAARLASAGESAGLAAPEHAPRAASAEPDIAAQRGDQTLAQPPIQARAASTTPSKRRAAEDRAAYMPSFSQIDPGVLSALPDDLRDEVLRDAAIRSRSAAGASRSKSESPRKKQRTASRPLAKAWSKTIVPADQPRAKVAVQAADPSKLSDADLEALEIDPAFFRALPLDMQRDTLHSQTRIVESKRARFKGRRHLAEQTRAEERRTAAERAARAAADVGGGAAEGGAPYPPLVLAHPARQHDEEAGRMPSLGGKHTTQDIVALLQAWFARQRATGPRANDSARFTAFLLACVHPDATPGAPALDLDKAATVLRAWLQLLRAAGFAEPPSAAGAEEAAQRWWSAFAAARDAVNARVQQRFGFALSLR